MQSFTASVLLWSLSALIPNTTLRLLGLAAPPLHLSSMPSTSAARRAELKASKVQTRLLKPHLGEADVVQQQSSSESDVEAQDAHTITNTWLAYINALRELCGSLHRLECEVRAVETDILLAIEAERQRKLQESINDKLDIAGIVPKSTGHGHMSYAHNCRVHLEEQYCGVIERMHLLSEEWVVKKKVPAKRRQFKHY
ncbi:hypothetical protein FB45DRAFT_871170 [Roridomyces roridus]|uniref:Uncharacterized protein n=1 Tax=Roridomyces roridus TaxID=1738132 RepID=A0AAD7BG92_9AGAR|nr:hypothetical protein FB45DRAFT_871170 [Roridomyces roridus]